MKTFAYAAAAALALATAPAMAQDWNATQVPTESGWRVGNPDADLQLVEFISPTCGHCLNFFFQSEGAMQVAYVPTGRVAVEVRPWLRNETDEAMYLLARCGGDDKFFGNFRAILSRARDWWPLYTGASASQRQRWTSGSFNNRMRAVASDLNLYPIMEARGYSRAQADTCLADEAAVTALKASRDADIEQYNLPGTPSFLVNGEFLDGVHSWETLRTVLDAPAQSD